MLTEKPNNQLAAAGLYEWLQERDPRLLVEFHEEAIEQHRGGLDAALEAWDQHVDAPQSSPSAAASVGSGASSTAAPDGAEAGTAPLVSSSAPAAAETDEDSVA